MAVIKVNKTATFSYPVHFGFDEIILKMVRDEIDNMLRNGVSVRDEMIITISTKTLVKDKDGN